MSTNHSLRSNALGVPSLVFLVVAAVGPMAAVLGATPLVFMQSGPGAAGTYVLAALLFAIFSVGYVAMSRYVGTAGGFVTYIARAFTHRAGSAAAYAALVVYGSLLCGLYAAFGVFTSQTFNDYLGLNVSWQACILVTIAVLGVLAYNRVEFNTRLLAIILIAEVLIILILDVAIIVQGGGGGGAAMSFEGFAPSAVLSSGIGIAFLFAIVSFGGFEATVVYSEEARNPRRTIPRATYLAVALIGGFYALSTWAIANGVGNASVQDEALADPIGFILVLSDTYLGGTFTDVMSILVVTSFLAILLGFTNILSRYVFALARVGVLPRGLARTHPKHQSPHRASIVVSVGIALVTVSFMLANADPFLTMYTLLLALGTVGLLSIVCATSVSTIVFFARNSRDESLFSTTVAPAISAVGFAIAIYLSVDNFALLTGGRGGLAAWLWLLIPLSAAIGYGVGAGRGPSQIDFIRAETDPLMQQAEAQGHLPPRVAP